MEFSDLSGMPVLARALGETSLGERLRRGIEEDILHGRLVPGDRLDERALAERFKVSRTPVREALRQLASLGLVTLQLRQGARVATVELTALIEMIEVMAVIEAEAARLAARRMTQAQRSELQAIHAEGAEAVARGDAAAFNLINWRLHQLVFTGSGNSFLAEEARKLRLRVHFYRYYLIRVRDGAWRAHEEHGRIVDAICTGDAETAFNETRQHLMLSSERMADLVALMPRDRHDKTPAHGGADGSATVPA